MVAVFNLLTSIGTLCFNNRFIKLKSINEFNRKQDKIYQILLKSILKNQIEKKIREKFYE